MSFTHIAKFVTLLRSFKIIYKKNTKKNFRKTCLRNKINSASDSEISKSKSKWSLSFNMLWINILGNHA